jgi:hypothetical protein
MDSPDKIRREMHRCSLLALEARILMGDKEVLDAVEKRAPGAVLDSFYARTCMYRKRERVVATAVLRRDHVELVMTGWGRDIKEAILHALRRDHAQIVIPFPDAEDLPF